MILRICIENCIIFCAILGCLFRGQIREVSQYVCAVIIPTLHVAFLEGNLAN